MGFVVAGPEVKVYYDGGYIDDVGRGRRNVNRADIYGGRADLLFTPGDALTIRLSGFAQDIKRDGSSFADYTFGGRPTDNALAQRRLIDEPFDQQFRLGSLSITYDLGGAAITSITSYQTVKTQRVLDYSAPYVPLLAFLGLPFGSVGLNLTPETRKFTNELRIASRGNGRIVVVANAGKARLYGGELTLIARPSREVTFSGAFAYAHARLAQDNADLGGRDGDRLPDVPAFTAAISGDYTAPSGSAFAPTFGATLRFVSDRSVSFDNSTSFPQYRLPDYTSVDLRAGAKIGPVDAQLYVRNLFDERGQLSGYTLLSTNGLTSGLPAQVSIMQPRTIGLSGSVKF